MMDASANAMNVPNAVYADGPRLVADIGGTHARFALERGPGQWGESATLATATHATIEQAIHSFLTQAGASEVRHAVIAIALPVTGDIIHMTNHHWRFSIDELRQRLGLTTLLIVNDFAALAMSLAGLTDQERLCVQPGRALGLARASALKAVTGPGSGLGVAAVVPGGPRGSGLPLASEGGHVSYAPQDGRERHVVAHARERFGHVSAERLISGPGLSLIHFALHGLELTPAEISAAAQSGDVAARASLECMFGMFGNFAGNLALTLGCLGGLYVAGGVVPANLECFMQSAFLERFLDKGRFRDWLSAVPVWVITAERPALGGAALMLQEHIVGLQSDSRQTVDGR